MHNEKVALNLGINPIEHEKFNIGDEGITSIFLLRAPKLRPDLLSLTLSYSKIGAPIIEGFITAHSIRIIPLVIFGDCRNSVEFLQRLRRSNIPLNTNYRIVFLTFCSSLGASGKISRKIIIHFVIIRRGTENVYE